MKKMHLNWFEIVYIAISIATFQHTMWSSAITFEGLPPDDLAGRVFWYFNGALIAVAIDIGMFVAAKAIAKTRSPIMIIAFLLAATASMYTQLMFAITHAGIMTFSAGVTAVWQSRLNSLIDARIVIMPTMLPLFAVMYTIAGIRQERIISNQDAFIEIDNVQVAKSDMRILESQIKHDQFGWMCKIDGYTRFGYKTAKSRDGAIRGYFKKNFPRLRGDEERMWENVTLFDPEVSSQISSASAQKRNLLEASDVELSD